jgi:hypothetical protein
MTEPKPSDDKSSIQRAVQEVADQKQTSDDRGTT